jgi:hypothetical protein
MDLPHMEVLLIALVALVAAGSTVVTLSWAVPAATQHYFRRRTS